MPTMPNTGSRPDLPPDPSPILSRPPPQAVTYDLSRGRQRVRITLPPGSAWTSGLHWHESHDEYLRVVRGAVRLRLGDGVRVISATGSGSASGSDRGEGRCGRREGGVEDGDGVGDGAEGGGEKKGGKGEGEEGMVPRGVWHEWSRADDDGCGGEDVVVEERTEPADGEKAVFFWNLNGVLLDAARGHEADYEGWANGKGKGKGRWLGRWMTNLWVTVSLWTIFRELDNYPVFVGFEDVVLGRVTPVSQGSVARRLLGWMDWCVTHSVLAMASWAGWAVGVRAVRDEFTPREEYERWMTRRTGAARKVV